MSRTFSIFGDSISTYEGYQPEGYAVFYDAQNCARADISSVDETWWMQVVNAFGGSLLANAAWSGSMVEGACFPCGSSAERIDALATEVAEPTDILVYYGINDYGWGSAAAQLLGGGSATPYCLFEGSPKVRKVAGNAPATAAQHFGESYQRMLQRMREAYPQARIWCFTMLPGRVRGQEQSTFPYCYRGVPFAAYNQAIVEAAAACGATAVDIAAYGFDYDSIEGTHPTALGMKQMAALMVRGMRQVEAAATAGEGEGEEAGRGEGSGVGVASEGAGVGVEAATAALEAAAASFDGALFEGFESSDPCVQGDTSCVGCSFALSTGNSWMHVCQAHMQDR